MKSTRLCLACGNPFHPLLQVPNQRYCSAPGCQRERRRRWQREHLNDDADYRDNQAHAQAKWRARHPDYWRQYRATHPVYPERNCAMQRKRNAQRTASSLANMDASSPFPPTRIRLLHTAPCGRNRHCKDERVHRAHRRAVGTKRTTIVIAKR